MNKFFLYLFALCSIANFYTAFFDKHGKYEFDLGCLIVGIAMFAMFMHYYHVNKKIIINKEKS